MRKWLLGIVAVICMCSSTAQAAPMDSLLERLSITRYTEHIEDHPERRQALCLALNVYHEARGSTRTDQVGVAWATKNRVSRSGHSYCRIIWAPGQFTWTVRSVSSLIPHEMAAWNRAVRISRQVMAGEIVDPTGGARNFRAARLGGGRGYRVIGAHAYW